MSCTDSVVEIYSLKQKHTDVGLGQLESQNTSSRLVNVMPSICGWRLESTDNARASPFGMSPVVVSEFIYCFIYLIQPP
jgi:hypothetical protein